MEKAGSKVVLIKHRSFLDRDRGATEALRGYSRILRSRLTFLGRHRGFRDRDQVFTLGEELLGPKIYSSTEVLTKEYRGILRNFEDFEGFSRISRSRFTFLGRHRDFQDQDQVYTLGEELLGPKIFSSTSIKKMPPRSGAYC